MTTGSDLVPRTRTSFADVWLPREVSRLAKRFAWATLVVQILLVGTGGLVRLTDSGLGCPTWPRCTADSLVTTPAMGIHGIIEFGNRMLTFVLILIAILTFLSVVRTRWTGRGLFSIALAIGLGIPAQGVIGGISVLTQLNPYVVGLHFVVSAVLVVLSALLVWRTYFDRADRGPLLPRWYEGLAVAAAVLTAFAVVLGILTTGSGPHAGDANAPRNGLDSEILQHFHSYPAYALFAVTILLIVFARRLRAGGVLRYSVLLLAVETAQIVVGVTQARLGLPQFLVGLHMILAVTLIAAMTAVVLGLRQRVVSAASVVAPAASATWSDR